MWRVILFALLALIMYFMVRSAIRGLLRDKRGGRSVGSSGSPAELVQDPVCGMYLAKEGAYFVREGERTHFFCSKACRASYEQKLSSA